jgi:hypothetical protein
MSYPATAGPPQVHLFLRAELPLSGLLDLRLDLPATHHTAISSVPRFVVVGEDGVAVDQVPKR